MLTMRLVPVLFLVACSLEAQGTKRDIPALEGHAAPDAAPRGEVDAGAPVTEPCTSSVDDVGCAEVDEPDAGPDDPCPSDSEKTSPGVCGCGTPDVDSDDDGVIDCMDVCIGFSDDSKKQGCTCDPARKACGNRPPTMTLVEPTSDTVQKYGLSIRVEAHDEDGAIRRVTLFVDGKHIRDEHEEPYRWGIGSSNAKELQRLSAGAHVIEVEAEDDQGATARLQRELTILP